MATFLDTEGYRKKEVKLDEWGLPSVMVRELYGDEAEELRDWVEANPRSTENALYRRIVRMACLNPVVESEDVLLKKPSSVIKHIATEIQSLGDMGAKAAEQAEKN